MISKAQIMGQSFAIFHLGEYKDTKQLECALRWVSGLLRAAAFPTRVKRESFENCSSNATLIPRHDCSEAVSTVSRKSLAMTPESQEARADLPRVPTQPARLSV